MILSIVIVNYKSCPFVMDCLASLIEYFNEPSKTRIFVVDNDSKDGSVDKIRQFIKNRFCESWVFVLPNNQNKGFGAGNNFAVYPPLNSKEAPDYFLLLNPDTVIKEGSVEALLNFMESWPKAGIAGSRLESSAGEPQDSVFHFHSLMGEIILGLRTGILSKIFPQWEFSLPLPHDNQRVDWVSGACMMIRREVFQDIGLFDEKFFLYFEEEDFCLRAVKSGWECWYVPQARVVHLVGESSGFKYKNQPWPRHWFESRRYFFLKHFGFFYTVCADLGWITGRLIYKLRRLIQFKPIEEPQRFFRDFVKNSVIFHGA